MSSDMRWRIYNDGLSEPGESGQSAEDVLNKYANQIGWESFEMMIDNWIDVGGMESGIMSSFKEAMRLHASQVCADKDREIDLLNESLTVMLRKNAELLESVRPEVVVPSEEVKLNASDKYGFRVPYNGSNNFYDKKVVESFEGGWNECIETVRRLNPALTFTELNHTEK